MTFYSSHFPSTNFRPHKMETEKPKEIIIAPLRNTHSLQIAPEAKEFSEIARRQLESLTKTGKKPRKQPSVDTSIAVTPPPTKSESPVTKVKMTEITVISPPSKSNLTSSIVSKAELETEIRNKVSSVLGSTEIPHEILMADLETSTCELSAEQEPALHDQELIDILEGKSDEIELIVQSSVGDDMQYIGEIEIEDESKRMEREIALQQITSIAPRKNKRSYLEPATPGAVRKLEQLKQTKTLADSLAADWTDEEIVYEVVNVDEPTANESSIKILNMKVVQETTTTAAPKKLIKTAVTLPTVPTRVSGSPKILNINASPTQPAASFKRARIVKKKEIFDPSSQTKSKELQVQLPASITIKKVTKETIAEQQEKSTRGKRGKRSEIDKLLGDEGAVKMIYSLERENNNQDVPEIEVKPNDESLIDKSEEKNSLITRANAIKNAVMKKSVSPPDTGKAAGRARKRDSTPVTTQPQAEEKKPVRQATKPVALKKKKDDENWDYVYASRPAQTTCDDAMIIRRRSNSSYSSSAASPRRQSIDVESPRKELNSFEFTKPPEKNDSKAPADFFKKDFVEELRGKITDVINGEKSLQAAVAPAKGRKRAAAAVDAASSPTKRSSRANGNEQKLLKVEKTGQIAKLTLAQSSLSIQLMSELKSALNQLENDDTRIVIVKSSDDGITGLNYKTLIQATADKRKQSASELLTALK